MKKYKDTLNLPKTDYPIKLNPKREEELIKEWEGLYSDIQKSRSNSTPFVLHDGPPYANGHLHHGHILNKVLKDIVVKYNNLVGKRADFKPGWDCHGLPIEVEVDKKLGPSRHQLSKEQLHEKYRKHASDFVDIQRNEFRRLGILADWDNPYLTMSSAYRSQIVAELNHFNRAGLLYKDLKPVFWCPNHRTALANSDIEYKEDHVSNSVFVLMPMAHGYKEYLAVWTTTPWTLYVNKAVAVNKNAFYVLIQTDGKEVWVAEELAASLIKKFDWKNTKVMARHPGYAFVHEPYINPLSNAVCPVVVSDHVTTKSGTGFVHIAPAHGEDDFRVGKKHELDVESAIGDNGKDIKGRKVEELSQYVIDNYTQQGLLLHTEPYTHSYPYSTRSHKPVIMKATEQWFINIDKPYNGGPTLRERALAALDEVSWLPRHGYNRIKGMLENRPDWCISRQRTWGVPITLNGREESDILDVWFDSGVSNAAVMGSKQVDLYLEGSDQHRGWFQSSLLAALGVRELVPYKTVLTHGFVVDENGEKLSKSKKNYVDPFKFINQNGVEILRLWVASAEFREDIRVSKDILDGVKQTHHKIRNTVRFMLSNLYDFSATDGHTTDKYLDKYILCLWREIYNDCMRAYEEYNFHRVVKLVENFCVNDLSSFYFDAIKDHMYCDHPNSFNRRSTQATLYTIASEIIPLLAPIMSFSMEDAWKELGNTKSVHLALLPKRIFMVDKELVDRYNRIRQARSNLYKTLEGMRNSKEIGAFTEADVWVSMDKLKTFGDADLSSLFGVSKVLVGHVGEEFSVEKAHGSQCQRCWKYYARLANTEVCSRCLEALSEGSIS